MVGQVKDVTEQAVLGLAAIIAERAMIGLAADLKIYTINLNHKDMKISYYKKSNTPTTFYLLCS